MIDLKDYDYVLIGFGKEFDTIEKKADAEQLEKINTAYEILAKMVNNSNYFCISINYDDFGEQYFEHFVAPCGSMKRYQCENGCETIFGDSPEDRCPVCGGKMVPNNIMCENYNENGYLPKWKEYTNWLEHTLNKKLLILELGVDFFAPSVIRFPFEKTCLYNRKADMIRVSERFAMIPEELAQRVQCISENSVDFIINMGKDGE